MINKIDIVSRRLEQLNEYRQEALMSLEMNYGLPEVIQENIDDVTRYLNNLNNKIKALEEEYERVAS
jgi:archaellum component FlaC